MKCPRCQSVLITHRVHEIEADRCPSCHGVWLDRGELDTIEQRLQHQNGGQSEGAGSFLSDLFGFGE